MNKPDERFEVSGTASSHFAWLRTRLALERTLMAWTRTSVALIGFGFTIVKFLESLPATQVRPVLLPQAPRDFGLALIGSGILALAISVWQYHRTLRYLWSQEFRAVAGVDPDNPYTTPIVFVAMILFLVGIFAFVAILFRLA